MTEANLQRFYGSLLDRVSGYRPTPLMAQRHHLRGLLRAIREGNVERARETASFIVRRIAGAKNVR